MSNVITVENLTVSVADKTIVQDVNFSLKKGEILGVIGQSGAGKTTLGFAVSNILSSDYTLEGSIVFTNDNVLALDKVARRKQTVQNIGVILQNAQSALDPYEKIDKQFREIIKFKHRGISENDIVKMIQASLEQVGLADENILKKYPSELSGGMKQRVVLAMSIIMSPKILVADEPTASLDGVHKLNFLKLLKDVTKKVGLSLILISHDIALILNICDKILVLDDGAAIAYGSQTDILNSDNTVIKDFIDKTKKLLGDGDENS